MSKEKSMKIKCGFTLIELLAVIVILAGLAVFALPAIINLQKQAAKDLFAAQAESFVKAAKIQYARTEGKVSYYPIEEGIRVDAFGNKVIDSLLELKAIDSSNGIKGCICYKNGIWYAFVTKGKYYANWDDAKSGDIRTNETAYPRYINEGDCSRVCANRGF